MYCNLTERSVYLLWSTPAQIEGKLDKVFEYTESKPIIFQNILRSSKYFIFITSTDIAVDLSHKTIKQILSNNLDLNTLTSGGIFL